MKIETTVSALLAPVKSAAMAVERKVAMPILACLLIETSADQTVITGTNLQNTIRVKTSIAATMEGSYALPAQRLKEILQSLPDDSAVVLTAEGSKTNSEVGKATLRCGRSRFVLNAFLGSEFPSPPTVDPLVSFTVAQQSLKSALERTAYAMAKDDVRYYLNGLMLQCGKMIRLVATDGHRLAVNDLCGFEYVDAGAGAETILPIITIDVLRKQLSDSEDRVTISTTDTLVSIDFGETQVIAQLINGKFPDYQRVIPRTMGKVVIADRLLLRNALCRAGIVLNDKSQGVRLCFEDWLLRIQAKNSDNEESEDEIEINYSGGPIEMGFNNRYLLAALDALGCANVKLSMQDVTSSILLENAEGGMGQHVIMPMRL